jgi:hypothetical protein
MPTRSGQGRWSKGPIGNLLAQEKTEAMSPPTCIAYQDDGTICRAPATILDYQRGGMVCLQHVPDENSIPLRGRPDDKN